MWQPHKIHRVGKMQFQTFKQVVRKVITGLRVWPFKAQFNIQQIYVQPTQCIYVFCVDVRTNSGYFPIQPSQAKQKF